MRRYLANTLYGIFVEILRYDVKVGYIYRTKQVKLIAIASLNVKEKLVTAIRYFYYFDSMIQLGRVKNSMKNKPYYITLHKFCNFIGIFKILIFLGWAICNSRICSYTWKNESVNISTRCSLRHNYSKYP
jgi:hypothetical protein